MKIQLANMEINCTVDEFEEIIARGLLEKKDGTAATKTDPLDNLTIPKAQPFKPYDVVALYGCQVLSNEIGDADVKGTVTTSSTDLSHYCRDI